MASSALQYLIPHFVDRGAELNFRHDAVRMHDQSLNYGQLSQRSNHLAATLLECGLQRGDRVGIYLGKSMESVVAMYGVMKAGGAYVPLDSSAPAQRIATLIEDCGIRHVISQDSLGSTLQEIANQGQPFTHAIGLDSSEEYTFDCVSWDEAYRTPLNSLARVKLIDQDLAYIIYTSGSTGQPKGIMHTHHSSLSFCRWAVSTYGLNTTDRLSNQAPLHFDMSIFEFFSAAVANATTVIIPDDYLRMPASYSDLIAKEKITTVFTVPFALSQLLFQGALDKRDLSALRWIIFGGDNHSPEHIRRLMGMLPTTRFSHMYGPAETNGCTYQHVDTLPEDGLAAISIGVPCDNMEGLVLGEDERPVATGDIGELLIRGPTLMQGYWNRPDLTRKVFHHEAIVDNYEARYFRTGDLVEVLPDGCYRFVGRKDRQVKIRGYRVELDEIEMALCAQTAVKEAAAFPVDMDGGGRRIDVAVTLHDNRDVSTAEILGQLRKQLPRYSMPSRIECVSELPRNTSGKVDRRLLQARAQKTGS